MNIEDNFINTLFDKTEETEAVKPQTTEIVNMPVSSIVPNFKNPYKCREEDMKPLEDSIRENGIIQPLMVRKDDKADVFEIVSGVPGKIGKSHGRDSQRVRCPGGILSAKQQAAGSAENRPAYEL